MYISPFSLWIIKGLVLISITGTGINTIITSSKGGGGGSGSSDSSLYYILKPRDINGN